MTAADLRVLAPLIALATAAVAVALAAAFRRSHGLAAGGAAAGLGLALLLLPLAAGGTPRRVAPLLVVDDFGLLVSGLLFGAALMVALLAYDYLRGREAPEEFYVLLLLAALGAGVVAQAGHLASLFIGVELLSVSLYVLIAYPRESTQALEAGLKYLVLAGASSGFLLFGMALLYAETGTLELTGLGARLPEVEGPIPTAGLVLLLAGLGFKLAAVPFHMWTPDVYQGAPAPVTAFLATVSKGAVVALLPRLFGAAGVAAGSTTWLLVALIAVASMLVGNLLALFQDNVKRILAYSSIAHLGYLLVAVLAGGPQAGEAIGYYLAAYFVTSLGAFGVVGILSGPGGEVERLEEYGGLLWRRPWVAGFFAATLFSLAGIPLTAGFVGKFYIFSAGVAAARWLLILAVALTSTVGLFYYLRIIVAMFTRPAKAWAPRTGEPFPALSPPAGLVLALLALLLLGLGVYPSPLVRLLQLAGGPA
ncbi:MAG: NADH-quinone oxidoreductase subunit N [Candidatus Methylomirabilales bacterium]